MLSELIVNKVYYKFFDKSFKDSTYLYGKYKARSSEDLISIDKNKKNILSITNKANILVLNQVHGQNIIDADLVSDFSIEPLADASLTTREDVVLSIQTADCVPVLLANSEGNIIGAAHCGWRSSKANIISKLITLMKTKGARDILAIIGPCIQQSSYEVDENYYQDFLKDNRNYAKFFILSKNMFHYNFNLPAFVANKLAEENVKIISQIKEDTYLNSQKYPSYRRLFHQGSPSKYENILSTIMINNQ